MGGVYRKEIKWHRLFSNFTPQFIFSERTEELQLKTWRAPLGISKILQLSLSFNKTTVVTIFWKSIRILRIKLICGESLSIRIYQWSKAFFFCKEKWRAFSLLNLEKPLLSTLLRRNISKSDGGNAVHPSPSQKEWKNQNSDKISHNMPT